MYILDAPCTCSTWEHMDCMRQNMIWKVKWGLKMENRVFWIQQCHFHVYTTIIGRVIEDLRYFVMSLFGCGFLKITKRFLAGGGALKIPFEWLGWLIPKIYYMAIYISSSYHGWLVSYDHFKANSVGVGPTRHDRNVAVQSARRAKSITEHARTTGTREAIALWLAPERSWPIYCTIVCTYTFDKYCSMCIV